MYVYFSEYLRDETWKISNHHQKVLKAGRASL
jgi:hypothetical protein